MANPTITNNDTGSVALDEKHFENGTFVPGSAKTYPEGTILALNSSTSKWVVYVAAGANDTGTPRGVLTYDVVAPSTADMTIRILVSGVVNQNRLIVDADGTPGGSVTALVRAALRDKDIVPVDVTQLGQVDNPQPGGDS